MTTPITPTPPPSLPPRRRRGKSLRTNKDVRRGLAATINALWQGVDPEAPLDPKRANALVYAHSVLAGLLAGAALEDRIARLEAALAGSCSVGPRRLSA